MAIRIDEYGHIIRDDTSTNNSNVSVQNTRVNQFRSPTNNISASYGRNTQSTSRSTTPVLDANPAIPNSILILGILSIVFAGTYYLSVIGIICAIIGLINASSYSKANGQLLGKPRVGRNLCIGGLIASIVMAGQVLLMLLAYKSNTY